MSVLLRVEDEPPAARLDYFRHGLASAIAPYDLRVEADGPLRGASIRDGRVARVGITTVSLAPHRSIVVARRGSFDARIPELFKIDVQVRGSTAFAQSGRQVLLRPGDFTFMDLSRPSRVRHLGDEHGLPRWCSRTTRCRCATTSWRA